MPFEPSPTRRWRAALAIGAAVLLVAACGGGSGGSTGAPGASPASYLTGRITGFGSVIVDGIRLDDSAAQFDDDDGDAIGRDDLGLGMVVEVEAGEIDDASGTGTATHIVVRSEVKGPVEAVDAGAGTLTVLGQAVRTDAATVYEDLAGLAALAVGDLVEVYALPAADGTLRATRIEAKGSLERYKLRGTVVSVDDAAQTLRIGGATIAYGGIPAGERPALRAGMVLKAVLETTPVDGAWVATKLRAGEREIEVGDRDEAEVEGTVSGFVSLADFKVGGVPVDASGSDVVFERGTAADVVDGARVEVEGAVVDGRLVARKVKIEDGDEAADREVELHGAIESVDPATRRIVVRGVTVQWTEATVFRDGSATGLVAGARVEVKAQLVGDAVVAERIDFE